MSAENCGAHEGGSGIQAIIGETRIYYGRTEGRDDDQRTNTGNETQSTRSDQRDYEKMVREQWKCKQNQLNQMMRTILFEQMDVAEAYSRPRIAAMAEKMGLRAGWSLDLTTCDEEGRPWDFNNSQMRNAAIRKLLQHQPRLLIGSPMCGPFGTMNNMNYSKMSAEEKQMKIA